VYANGVVHKADIDIELKKFAELNLSVKALKGVSQALRRQWLRRTASSRNTWRSHPRLRQRA